MCEGLHGLSYLTEVVSCEVGEAEGNRGRLKWCPGIKTFTYVLLLPTTTTVSSVPTSFLPGKSTWGMPRLQEGEGHVKVTQQVGVRVHLGI